MGVKEAGSQIEVHNLRALIITQGMPWTQEQRHARECNKHKCHNLVHRNDKGAASQK